MQSLPLRTRVYSHTLKLCRDGDAMFAFDLFRLAVFSVLAYCGAMFWAWWRAERLRSTPGAKTALPSTTGFFTGAAFLWIWGGHHRQLNDKALSLAVLLARAFFVIAMALWAASIFQGL